MDKLPLIIASVPGLIVYKYLEGSVKTSTVQQSALSNDEVVDARKGQRLIFTKEAIKVINTKRCCVRKKQDHEIKYSDMKHMSVEWYCFSGALVIKDYETTYRFVFGKVRLMQAASALRRKMETSSGRHRSVAAKVRQLLDGYPDVGVTDTGLITKKKKTCCTSTAAYIPWKAIVAIRMTRTCCSGTITVSARTEEEVHGEETKGLKFGTDISRTTINIKTHRATSEALYQPLTTIMSTNFSHTEELPGMHIQNTHGHVKATMAGMFLDSDISCCGEYVKTFMPWGSMVAMAYRHGTCCKSASLLIEDRLQTPMKVGTIVYKDFEEIRGTFSKTVAEISEPSEDPCMPNARGLTLSKEGMQYVTKYCGKRQLFVPWSKIDGLMIRMGTCGCSGAIHLITEAGHDFTVLKSRNRALLWEKFDEVHQRKYGTQGSSSKDLCFNEDATNNRNTCVLTDQSLRLCLKKGKQVYEVDLERVVGAKKRRGKEGIDIALSVGRDCKCLMLFVLVKNNLAAAVAEEIRTRSTQRKIELKKVTGLIA